MTALQIVFAATVAVVVVAIGLVVSGVAILAGLGWALVGGGVLLAVTAVTVAVVLLRDGAKK
ncbi:hypothetical protein [Mycobacteroides abscessus]|uniref:hypothetical protein n=1 Tax=Mycobacteroides abscessus TaxID=36809 RepID=UPI000D3E6238|nr:hypothetical protein [Mycobacteroides abscessus]PVA66207.1 hypothetical protein DDJ87_08760 [Mycobacteroides abscessus]